MAWHRDKLSASPGHIASVVNLNSTIPDSRQSRLGDLEQGPVALRTQAQINQERSTDCHYGVDDDRAARGRDWRSPYLHENRSVAKGPQGRRNPTGSREGGRAEKKADQADSDGDETKLRSDDSSRKRRHTKDEKRKAPNAHRLQASDSFSWPSGWRVSQACPALRGLRFFDCDLMTMRVWRVRGKVTPECLIAALISAWISP
jgi:hypothetical protein